MRFYAFEQLAPFAPRKVHGGFLEPVEILANHGMQQLRGHRGSAHRAKIEYGINHVHLWDYVPDADDNQDDSRELHAACETVAHAWRLRAAFPDRELYVVIEDSYGPTAYAITKSPTSA